MPEVGESAASHVLEIDEPCIATDLIRPVPLLPGPNLGTIFPIGRR